MTEPQTEFVIKFSDGFVEVNEFKPDEMDEVDEQDVDFEDEIVANPEEDMKDEELSKNINTKPIDNNNLVKLQNNPEYRNWLIRSRAVVNALQLIEKFS